MGFFGCEKGKREWDTYDEAYPAYSEEVVKSLTTKVESVVEDEADTLVLSYPRFEGNQQAPHHQMGVA